MVCWEVTEFPRGKLLKTKVKERKRLVKAELQAKKEWEQRTSNFPYLLKKQLLEALKRVDPLELAAVGALTVVIQPIIQTSAEIITAVQTMPAVDPALVAPLWDLLGLRHFLPELEADVGALEEDIGTPLRISTMMSWLLAFVVAFIMVRHPDMVIGTLTGITRLALGLIV